MASGRVLAVPRPVHSHEAIACNPLAMVLVLDLRAVPTEGRRVQHHETFGQGGSVRLTFLGKDPDSKTDDSPTIYATDRGTYVVQGWIVTDSEALSELGDLPDGETVIEIPGRVVQFFKREDRAVNHD
jgi:hypothetical protein